MKRHGFILAYVGLSIASATGALAIEVLPAEPGAGALRPGQTVYVACGSGKARAVSAGTGVGSTGGKTANVRGIARGTSPRTRGPCKPISHL